MSFRNFFIFLIMSSVFVGLCFSESIEEDRAKARQSELERIAKRQALFTALEEKREEKRRQRQMTSAEAQRLEQEREAVHFALEQERLAPLEGSEDFSKKSLAYGILLKFKEWPPSKEAEILKELESAGLTEDAQLKKLQKWIYKWSEPREVSEAEELCRKLLSSFRSVEYCEPDIAVGPANARSDLYEQQLERAREQVKSAEKEVELAKKDVETAQKEFDELLDLYEWDKQAVQNAEQEVASDKRSVERAKQNLERAKRRNQGVPEAEERLKDRERMLEDSEKWLSRMRDQVKKSKTELDDSKKWLDESKQWLDESEKLLKERRDWLKELESKNPNKSPTPSCSGGQVWDGSACVCPSGQSWDGSSCVAPKPGTPSCSGGQEWDGSACVCPGDKSKWDGSQCIDPGCSGGQEWDGSACVCPGDKSKWDGSQCVDPGCSGGQEWDGSACVCPGDKSKWDGSQCIDPGCSGGQVWNRFADKCICTDGKTWDGSQCVDPKPAASSCSNGKQWSRYLEKCACPESKPNWDGSQCVDPGCSGGQEWDGSTCVCPSGQTLDHDKKKCVMKCSGGQEFKTYWFTNKNGKVKEGVFYTKMMCTCPHDKPKWDGSKCVPSNCPGGKTWHQIEKRCFCDKRLPHWDGSKCTTCPDGQVWDYDNSKCAICPKEEYWHILYKRCAFNCPDKKTDKDFWKHRKDKKGDGSNCSCPPGRPTWDGSKCVSANCPDGRYWSQKYKKCVCYDEGRQARKWDGSKCVSMNCPGSQIWNPFSEKCICPHDKPKWDGSKCVTPSCSEGQLWSYSYRDCMCPVGMKKDGSKCVKCPEGQVSDSLQKKCVCKQGAKECGACPKGSNWDGNRCRTCYGGKIWNESVSVCACPKGHTWSGSKCIEPEEGLSNLRTCGALSSNFNLGVGKFRGKGTLPDYWAQKMIGADLLKEEFSQAPPVKKKPFVQLFDSNKQGRHDEFVKNIISSKGPHSVLPELGDGIRTFETNYLSDYSKHTERLLNDVDKVCAEPSNKSNGNSPSTGNR